MYKIIQLSESRNKELEGTVRTSTTFLSFLALVSASMLSLTDTWVHLVWFFFKKKGKTPQKTMGIPEHCGRPENLLESSLVKMFF